MLALAEHSDSVASSRILAKTSASGAVARTPFSGARAVEMNRSIENVIFTPGMMDIDEGAAQAFWRRAPQNSHMLPDAFAMRLRVSSSVLFVPTESWVKSLYEASRGKVVQKQIIDMFDALETSIYSDIDWLDTTLAIVDVNRLAPEFMVGIPRALFPLKDHLFNWRPFVLRTWNELSRRKLDVRELLQGLL